jgi:hypothetical protein
VPRLYQRILDRLAHLLFVVLMHGLDQRLGLLVNTTKDRQITDDSIPATDVL